MGGGGVNSDVGALCCDSVRVAKARQGTYDYHAYFLCYGNY